MNTRIGFHLAALGMILFAGGLRADIIVDAGTTSSTIAATGPQFGTLDLNTGVFTPINTSEPTLAGMATLNNNTEYGADFEGTPNSNLYSINPATGNLSTIGSAPLQYYDFGGTLSGLYAVNEAPFMSDFTLYSINSATGAATPIGTSGSTGVPSTGESSFSSNSNTLYMANNNTFYTVNTTTGVATPVGTFNDNAQFDALIAEGGVLYGYDGSNNTIDTINPSTGAVTLGPTLSGVAAADVSIFGMAAIPPISTVPEPRSYSVLLGAALVGALLLRRRKVAA
jgi:hypothetical protein